MDPLSLSASIIAVLQLTQCVTTYANSIRHASADQKRVAIEASNLYNLLTTLRFRVDDAKSSDPWFNQIKLLGTENGLLNQLRRILERLVQKTPNSSSAPTSLNRSWSKLTWHFTKKEVEELLSRTERLNKLINLALIDDLTTLTLAINNRVDDIVRQTGKINTGIVRIQETMDDEFQRKLSDWLGLPDPSINYRAAIDKRHAKTGLWLKNGPTFAEWKDSVSSSMWLYGKAGCGKTVLSSTVLEDIIQTTSSSPDTNLCYFFFDFNDRDKQSWKKAVRSLLFQLSNQIPGSFRALRQLYNSCHKGSQQPPENTIIELFRSSIIDSSKTYILLDALDECDDREDFLKLLESGSFQNHPGLHLIVTSRCERDIEQTLTPIVDHKVDIQSALVEDDIRAYVHARLEIDRALKKWPIHVREEISQELVTKADGMFRWVYCQLEAIKKCIRLSSLRQTLQTLPKTLDATYDRIMEQIESQGELDSAVWILQWLCFSTRPLQLSEINDVLAMRRGHEKGFWPEERLADPFDVMSICSSLIHCTQLDDERSHKWSPLTLTEVKLAHYSVKEYLLAKRSPFTCEFQAATCHEQITEACLMYLLHICQAAKSVDATNLKYDELLETVQQYPLSTYAATMWMIHAREVDGQFSTSIIEAFSHLIREEPIGLAPWFDFDSFEWRTGEVVGSNKEALIIHLSSYGLVDLVSEIVSRGADLEAKGDEHTTAVYEASYSGHEEIVQLLLNHGANVDSKNCGGETALMVASWRGYEPIMRLLLNWGADVDAKHYDGSTALMKASLCRCEDAVQLLLDWNVDTEAKNNTGQTALGMVHTLNKSKRSAADREHEGIERLFWKHGAKDDIIPNVFKKMLDRWARQ